MGGVDHYSLQLLIVGLTKLRGTLYKYWQDKFLTYNFIMGVASDLESTVYAILPWGHECVGFTRAQAVQPFLYLRKNEERNFVVAWGLRINVNDTLHRNSNSNLTVSESDIATRESPMRPWKFVFGFQMFYSELQRCGRPNFLKKRGSLVFAVTLMAAVLNEHYRSLTFTLYILSTKPL